MFHRALLVFVLAACGGAPVVDGATPVAEEPASAAPALPECFVVLGCCRRVCREIDEPMPDAACRAHCIAELVDRVPTCAHDGAACVQIGWEDGGDYTPPAE